jgi:hypothetical protein
MGRQSRLRRERRYERLCPQMTLIEMLLTFMRLISEFYGKRLSWPLPAERKARRMERRKRAYVASTATYAASVMR